MATLLAARALRDDFEHRRLDVDREHLARRADQRSDAEGVIAGAGAEIGDRLSGLDPERVDHQLRLLFGLALRALEPENAARSHDLRDLAAEIELADAVGIVRRADFVALAERLGVSNEHAQATGRAAASWADCTVRLSRDPGRMRTRQPARSCAGSGRDRCSW